MITADTKITNMMDALARTFNGRVDAYEGSTLAFSSASNDDLKNFTVTRTGEGGKFFGFGVSQQIEIHLLDKDRQREVGANHSFKAAIGVDDTYSYCFPTFYVSEVSRDENTNELTIKAQDALYSAAAHTVSELGLALPYTIGEFAAACGVLLGCNGAGFIGVSDFAQFNYYTEEYPPNFNGTETIRAALDAIAEATQTIYYIESESNSLEFKRLNKNGAPVLSITKNKYFELKTKEARVLNTIVSATELGENLEVSAGSGDTQFIRNNPFWELLPSDAVARSLTTALENVGGTSIVPFNCKWRGNFLLEIGDKIALTTKDNSTVLSYLLNEVLTYDGALSSDISWEYAEKKAETATNPVTIGEKINQTVARVDKVNKEISLVVSTVEENEQQISELKITTEGIDATVSEQIESLTQSVNTKVSAEDVQISIQSELADGVGSVTTKEKLYTLNDDGLTIADSDSEISTQIDHDGMKVYRDSEAVLIADNQGVKAEDLHATTYLIIGDNSRLEDWKDENNRARTACFWIGG